MWTELTDLISGLDVIEEGDTITITGVHSYDVVRLARRIWKTSVLEAHMFKTIRRTRIEFYKFFAVDVLYMFEKMASTRDSRIPVRKLKGVVELLKTKTWLKDIHDDKIPGRLDFSKLNLFHFEPKDYQRRFFEYYDKTPSHYRLKGALLNAAAGSGKGLPKDTLVKIPNGWKAIGDLVMGDEVNTPSGDKAKVIGIYDNLDVPCYRIMFADGRTIVCDEDHLWEVFSEGWGSQYKTIKTSDLYREYNKQRLDIVNKSMKGESVKGDRYDFYIPLVDPTHSADEEVKLPLEPYLLGLLLGNDNPLQHDNILVPKSDVHISNYLYRTISKYNTYLNLVKCSRDYKYLTWNLLPYEDGKENIESALSELNLMGVTSYQKYIPKDYLNASFNQRLELLQGLMDVNGDIDPDNPVIEFEVNSKELAKDVGELARSVGAECNIMEWQNFKMVDGNVIDDKPYYQLLIRAQIPSLLFKSPIKKKKCQDNHPYVVEGLKLNIVSMEPVDPQDTRCIKVDHPDSMYVIQDYLCTHNTYQATATMELANVDKIIVVCPKNALERVWYNDIMKFYKTPPKVWNTTMSTLPDPDTKIYVYHYEAMDKILDHHLDKFNQYNYGLILDESHNLNDMKSQRTQKWLEICFYSKSNNIIHSSGTPFKAIGSESIPLFKAIDPMFSRHVEERYKKIYGSSAQRGLDILQNRLGIVSFVVLKEELGLDKPIMESLPIKVPNGKRFTLSVIREEMKQYIMERYQYYKNREVEDLAFYKQCLEIHHNSISDSDWKAVEAFNTYKDYVKEIQRTQDISKITDKTSYCRKYEFNEISASLPKEYVKPFRSVCSVIKYLTLKIQGECLGNVVGKRRIEAHQAMCQHIPFYDICNSTGKKTVVFTSYVDVLQDAYNTCKKQELNPILVYGKTNNNLNGMIKQFEQDGKINPLIATYDSLSTAVPLTMADTMIMINAPFRAYIQEQAISRIHRLNQDTQTKIYQCYLDTGEESNISSRSLDIMTWSQQQVEMITGVKSPYVLEDQEDGGMKISAESFEGHSYSLKDQDMVAATNQAGLGLDWTGFTLDYSHLPQKDGVYVFDGEKPAIVSYRSEW